MMNIMGSPLVPRVILAVTLSFTHQSPGYALDMPVAGITPWVLPSFPSPRLVPITPLLIEMGDTAFMIPLGWLQDGGSRLGPPPWRHSILTLEASLPTFQPFTSGEGFLEDGYGRVPGHGIYLKITVAPLPPKPAETFDASQRHRLVSTFPVSPGGRPQEVTLEAFRPPTADSFGLKVHPFNHPIAAEDGASPPVRIGSRLSNYFAGEDRGLVQTVLECRADYPDRPVRPDEIPQCLHSFRWRGMRIELQYHRSLMPAWHAVEYRVVELLHHFEAAARAALVAGAVPGPQ
jgi:hypothetical protein